MLERRLVLMVATLLTLTGGSRVIPAQAQTELIPGKRVIVKPNKLAKFLSKGTFALPLESATDPTVLGATIRFADLGGGAGDVTFDLPAANWTGLGKPAGAKGFKYKGAGTPDDPCKVVLIKDTTIKAVCKGTGVALVPPALGEFAVQLIVGSEPRRYCAEFGGEIVNNAAKVLKRKDAPAPAACAGIAPDEPTFTPTNTESPTPTLPVGVGSPTPTRTATATSTPGGGAVCGNGLFEAGETCAGCATDCQIGPCTSPSTPTQTFRVDFASPPFETASSITVRVGYRDNRVSIPGSGSAATVGARIVMRQSGATVTPNDLDYALRVVYSRAGGITPGRIFNVNFGTCATAAAVNVADFVCVVEGCSSQFGAITGCSCTVTTP